MMDKNASLKEIKTGKYIAYSSLALALLYALHIFVMLDQSVVQQMFIDAGHRVTDNAVGTILNSFRFTGIMYVLAYLAGIVAIWNRHPYLWWFMFAVYISNLLYNLVNLTAIYKALVDVKEWGATVPLSIVLVLSAVLAIYMLVVSIKRKSTFNR
ncbi:hypothetical protein N9R04_10585 [Staphylococcus sp. SQ8-PEA]|uniref:DUF2127 domain-containing protein n=1 Tax=Staphylococcus marylandisciuri TaxID=2981529 RepID=A0ABT2QSY2_9STAP|nr:hypothetical protein [Staphylococcus marylandisciuri]MCU5747105.1 hypothetical protein [Staphylococcus marylandisciuri]